MDNTPGTPVGLDATPQRRRLPMAVECVITVLTLAVGFGGGVLMTRDHSPAYAHQRQLTTDEVLEFVAQGGARCSVPMRHGSAKGGSQHSSCIENGKMRFEVSVSNSVGASYESFDLATDVGCITFDGARHSQYFVARDANWNLLTHDKALAATLLQLRGVTVATGGCPVDASQQPGLTGPMRPN